MTKQGGGGILPAGYIECEYIESATTENNYIVIPYTPNMIEDIEFVFARTQRNHTAVNRVIGCTKSFSMTFPVDGNGLYCSLFGASPTISSSLIPTNTAVNITISPSARSLFVNGVKNSTTLGTTAPEGDLQIFPASIRSYYRIYHFKQGESIDLIPCLDANGIPCLYDLIAGDTHYNVGTGTFRYKIKE